MDSLNGKIKEFTLDFVSSEYGITVYPVEYNKNFEWQSIGVVYDILPPENGFEFKQNIYDFKITYEIFPRGYGSIVGGRYYIKDQSVIDERDILEFSIIDKDDILGYFQYFGLKPGEDILELVKFIKTHSVIGGQLVEFTPGQSKIIPVGLYLRVSYTSFGNTPFKLKIDYFLPR